MDAMTVQIAKLELKAGDTLVVMVPSLLPEGARDHIRAALGNFIPDGVRCAILDGGMTLATISAAAK